MEREAVAMLKKDAVLIPLLILVTTVFCSAAELDAVQKPLVVFGSTYYAIQSDGKLMAWGDSFHGATGTDDDLPSFSQANCMLENAVFVTGNMNLGLAIDRDQTLWGWGWDWTGRLLGAGEAKSKPARLMDEVASAAVGLHHCLALKADGSLWSWGSNQYGQLGIEGAIPDNQSLSAHEPTNVMDHVRWIATDGMLASFAVKEDGSVWAWGKQDGCDAAVWSTPRHIFDHVQAVCWTQSGAYGSILLLGNDGNLWQSYFDSAEACYTMPEKAIEHVEAFSDNCGVTTDHALWVWGIPPQAAGDPSVADTAVCVMQDVLYAEAGGGSVLALGTDGSLWAMGGDYEAGGDPPSLKGPISLGGALMIPERQETSHADDASPTAIPSKTGASGEAVSESGGEAQGSQSAVGNGGVSANEPDPSIPLLIALLAAIAGIFVALKKRHGTF